MRKYALFVLCATTAINLSSQTFTTLHSFDNTDGANPFAGLVQATNGDFYGTTYGGGANGSCPGTVFKITPSGTLTTVHSFGAQTNCTDGDLPVGVLVQAPNGALYGTTAGGGANNRGTVFQITPSGTLTTLYSFCALTGCADGGLPYAGLIHANGVFYGTTKFGGAEVNGNGGTVFKITSGGALTTLYSFCALTGCADGEQPNAVLVQAANGNFYGTTLYGGVNNSGNSGTVFKITPSGALTTLYSFCAQTGCADGSQPVAGLVQAANGDLYGTTGYGGAGNNGTVFKITPSGALTTLYSFCPQVGCPDGQAPTGGLVQATDGNLYGTTDSGGIGYGTIFKITPSGTLTTLHSLTLAEGAEPFAGLIQGTNGDFYGTTFYDGGHGYGSVFSLSVGLGPFVETNPTSGKVGTAVKILGTDLTGATSVKFHGIAAVFHVVSKTEITTTVPAGATTGEVKVVTPGGTLSSNAYFRVP